MPHCGEQSEREPVWGGARNKALQGATTFFAQDAETPTGLYANAAVLHQDAAAEVGHCVG